MNPSCFIGKNKNIKVDAEDKDDDKLKNDESFISLFLVFSRLKNCTVFAAWQLTIKSMKLLR